MSISKYWYNKLLEVFEIQTNSENEKRMVIFLHTELTRLGLPYFIDSAGNILVIKGKADTYPCVVSHMDTVHNFVSDFILYSPTDNDDILYAKSNNTRVGVGGDDKCGVFACLYLLETQPLLKVVFFSREESGCQGSNHINHDFFKDCRYIIELDRRGKNDFICTYCNDKTISHAFSSDIGKLKKFYQYKNAKGTVTDVMKLWNNKVNLSVVNLSCGYYNPHTSTEYITISELWHSIKFTKAIIENMPNKQYPHLPPKPKYNTYNNTTVEYANCAKCGVRKQKHLLWWINKQNVCWKCREEIIDKNNKNSDGYSLCPWCNKEYTKGGIVCGECVEEYEKEYEEKHTKKEKDGGITINNTKHAYTCAQCKEPQKKGSLIYYRGGKFYCSNCILAIDSVVYMHCYTTINDGDAYVITNGEKLCLTCSQNNGTAITTTKNKYWKNRRCGLCNRRIPDYQKVIGHQDGELVIEICSKCAINESNINKD